MSESPKNNQKSFVTPYIHILKRYQETQCLFTPAQIFKNGQTRMHVGLLFPNKNKSRRCLFGFPLPKSISNSCQHAYGSLSVFSPHLRNSTSTLCALPQNSRLWSHVIGMTLSIWIISLLQSALLKHIRGVYVVYRSRPLFCSKH